jgi:hypothetical protein
MVQLLCSSRDGVHLGPEKDTHADKTVYQYGSIYTALDPALFSLDSTFKEKRF